MALITRCNANGSDMACAIAQQTCNNDILLPLVGNWDVYYVLTQDPDPYPPPLDNLFNSSFMSQIGAESKWQELNMDVYE
jgi:hypothetical protein